MYRAKSIRISPPAHERSWKREDIFIPAKVPRVRAVSPTARVQRKAQREETSPGALSPAAAQSKEPARAMAAASGTDRDFASVSGSGEVPEERRLFTIFAMPRTARTVQLSISHCMSVTAPQIRPETVTDSHMTEAQIRAMTAAERGGMRMPRAQQAEDERNMSMLTTTASISS